MGYTHYWYETKKPGLLSETAVYNIKEVIDLAYDIDLIQLEYDKPEKPLVNREEIRFNGIGENGHETFYYNAGKGRKATDGRYFDFCKTAHKPYDEVVMKVLLLLAYFVPTLEVQSDGDFSDEWKKSLEWFNKTMQSNVYVSQSLSFYR